MIIGMACFLHNFYHLVYYLSYPFFVKFWVTFLLGPAQLIMIKLFQYKQIVYKTITFKIQNI
jgi:hypothetical protein